MSVSEILSPFPGKIWFSFHRHGRGLLGYFLQFGRKVLQLSQAWDINNIVYAVSTPLALCLHGPEHKWVCFAFKKLVYVFRINLSS